MYNNTNNNTSRRRHSDRPIQPPGRGQRGRRHSTSATMDEDDDLIMMKVVASRMDALGIQSDRALNTTRPPASSSTNLPHNNLPARRRNSDRLPLPRRSWTTGVGGSESSLRNSCNSVLSSNSNVNNNNNNDGSHEDDILLKIIAQRSRNQAMNGPEAPTPACSSSTHEMHGLAPQHTDPPTTTRKHQEPISNPIDGSEEANLHLFEEKVVASQLEPRHEPPVTRRESLGPGAYACAPLQRPSLLTNSNRSLRSGGAYTNTSSDDGCGHNSSFSGFVSMSTTRQSSQGSLSLHPEEDEEYVVDASNHRSNPDEEAGASLELGLTPPPSQPTARPKEEKKDQKSPAYLVYLIAGGLCLLAIGAIIAVVVTKPSFLFGLQDDSNPIRKPSSPEEALQYFEESLTPSMLDAIHAHSNSSQAQAFEWLRNDPHLMDRPLWKTQQRYALASIYFSLNGPQWSTEDGSYQNWLSYEADECQWTRNIVACHKDGTFKKLKLVGVTNLEGSLPKEEVSLLPHLQELHITRIQNQLVLEDIISPELSQLKVLDCSFSNLTGSTLPTELGLLSSLEELKIEESNLQGTIPSQVSQLTALETISLANNDLTGTIPADMAQSLESLALDHNQLSGSLPWQWGTNLFSLESLSLRYNDLTGQLPPEWKGLSSMVDFRLENNDLSGTLPMEYVGWADIKSFGIDGNDQLSGTIPADWCLGAHHNQGKVIFRVDCNNFLCCGETSDELKAQNSQVAAINANDDDVN